MILLAILQNHGNQILNALNVSFPVSESPENSLILPYKHFCQTSRESISITWCWLNCKDDFKKQIRFSYLWRFNTRYLQNFTWNLSVLQEISVNDLSHWILPNFIQFNKLSIEFWSVTKMKNTYFFALCKNIWIFLIQHTLWPILELTYQKRKEAIWVKKPSWLKRFKEAS